MKILVTGGAGFIGANLLRVLEIKGEDVWVFDNLSRGSIEYLPSQEKLLQGDICDQDAVEEAMDGVETVIHLAAYGSVVESVNLPQPNFNINVNGTFNVLESARKKGVKKVIFASTGGALIGDATPPVNEFSLPKPISPYGASKLCGEAYCHAFAKAYGLTTICLRFANVYGPYSGHKKGAITKFFKCLLTGEEIPIFGDGSASRDFLHVDDLCTGIKMALDVDCPPGEVFHLASEREVTILELARLTCEISGNAEHPIQLLPKRPGEVERNFASSIKAKEHLNFYPEISLRAGLEKTWEWFINNKNYVLSYEESDS